MQTFYSQGPRVPDAPKRLFQGSIDPNNGAALKELQSFWRAHQGAQPLKGAASLPLKECVIKIQTLGDSLTMTLQSSKTHLLKYVERILVDGPNHNAVDMGQLQASIPDLQNQINALDLQLLEIKYGCSMVHKKRRKDPNDTGGLRKQAYFVDSVKSFFQRLMRDKLLNEIEMEDGDISSAKLTLRDQVAEYYAVDKPGSDKARRWCPITRQYWNPHNYRTAHIFPLSFGTKPAACLFSMSQKEYAESLFSPSNAIPMCRELWLLFNQFKVVVIPAIQPKEERTTRLLCRFLVLDKSLLTSCITDDDGNQTRLSDLHESELEWRNEKMPHFHRLLARWLIALEIRKYCLDLSLEGQGFALFSPKTSSRFHQLRYMGSPYPETSMHPAFLRQWALLTGMIDQEEDLPFWMLRMRLEEPSRGEGEMTMQEERIKIENCNKAAETILMRALDHMLMAQLPATVDDPVYGDDW